MFEMLKYLISTMLNLGLNFKILPYIPICINVIYQIIKLGIPNDDCSNNMAQAWTTGKQHFNYNIYEKEKTIL